MSSQVDNASQALDRLAVFSPDNAEDIATVRGEIERLREDAYREHMAVEGWSLRAEAAEAEMRRLTEGLREIAEYEGYGESPAPIVVRFVQDKARALLAGSEAEPDEGGEA